MSLALDGALDTNIVLRWLLGDNSVQTKAVDAMMDSGKQFRIATVALAEVVYVLESKNFSRSQIKISIETLSAQPNLYMDRSTLMPALNLYEAHKSISFVDACLAFDAKDNHAEPLYTFDKKLAKRIEQVQILG